MNELKFLIAPQDWVDRYANHISWYGGDVYFNKNIKGDNFKWVKQDDCPFSKQIVKIIKSGNAVKVIMG